MVDALVGRLLAERIRRGPLDISSEAGPPSSDISTAEVDALSYLLMRDIARHDRAIERLACEAADEMAIAFPDVDIGLAELRASDVDELDHSGES